MLESGATSSLTESLLNSFKIAIPATIIPIAIASFVAYGFAWIDFKGRKPLFIFTVSLLAIPLQVALLPLLQMYTGGAHLTIPFLDKTITLVPDLEPQRHDDGGLADARRLRHAVRHLPAAQLHLRAPQGPVRGRPDRRRRPLHDLLAASCSRCRCPVLAAFAIFQFLWTWNDFLIANTMIGNNPDNAPTTILVANMAGDFGRNEFILPSAAFVQAFIPIIVFFALQRYFVRGILAGSVKG